MKTILTVEESQRLIELGVDPKLAKSVCLDFNGTYAYISGEETKTVVDWVNMEYYTEQPVVFTLTDILSILPKEIKQVKKHPMTMVVYWHSINNEWNAYYDYSELSPIKSSPELIDALNQLLIYVLENFPNENHKN